MKILLTAVNAKYIHSNLAVYDLKSFAKKWEEHLELAEYTINQPMDDVIRDIYTRQPDVICLSCYIWNISYVNQLTTILHQIMPQIPIWLGGPEVSFDPEQELRNMPQITGILVGEGEQTFCELTEYYVCDKLKLDSIHGLVYRTGVSLKNDENEAANSNPEIIRNAPRNPMDLSEVPFPYYDCLSDFKNKIIYYETSRGCPFSCSYCLSSVDKRLRFRDLALVKRELQFFIDHEIAQVKFVDRTFNCAHEHAMAIWRYIIEHDKGKTNFHFEVAADLLNEEEIALIQTMRPGLIQLEIGVQTTNEKTLEAIRRKMDFSKVEDIVNQIHKNHNVHQHLDLIAGLPYENLESFENSFNQVYALKPEQLQLGFLKVLKGSYMYEAAAEYGCVYKPFPPYEVLSTRWLGYAEVLKLKQVEEMVEVYYNSGQFTNTIEYLVKEYAHPFSFYEALGEFYETHNYSQISHSRIRRYDILLEFVRERNVELEARVIDYMMLDLYLRENVKSRPSWAPEYGRIKDIIRAWYQQQEIKQDTRTHVEYLLGEWYYFDYQHKNPLTGNAEYKTICMDTGKYSETNQESGEHIEI
ncbi:MAG: B12-binding domain-containing radical SAM protein [Lachnospiraceae bacterium]|nr:B12-binding domain-containing radical SAM protein [Lachnospiraceae bacterium]MDD3616844.1 B12-binding domain-containing radical SAM protein [Lachnospiraceae bacterium]